MKKHLESLKGAYHLEARHTSKEVSNYTGGIALIISQLFPQLVQIDFH